MKKYSFFKDKNKYITGYYENSTKGIEFEITEQFLNYMNCYKVEDNSVIFDEEKYDLVVAEELKEKELTELKNYILDTSDTANDFVEELLLLDNPLTFVSDFVALIKSYRETYKTILAQRKQARQRIKELEK